MRSPFRAKHHVVVQYMVRWMKCPLPSPSPQPPPPTGPPPPPDPPAWRRQGGQGRIDNITDRQGTSHCSCLEHCFLLSLWHSVARLVCWKTFEARSKANDFLVQKQVYSLCAKDGQPPQLSVDKNTLHRCPSCCKDLLCVWHTHLLLLPLWRLLELCTSYGQHNLSKLENVWTARTKLRHPVTLLVILVPMPATAASPVIPTRQKHDQLTDNHFRCGVCQARMCHEALLFFHLKEELIFSSGTIADMAVSNNGELCCTVSDDKTMKVFDVVNFGESIVSSSLCPSSM